MEVHAYVCVTALLRGAAQPTKQPVGAAGRLGLYPPPMSGPFPLLGLRLAGLASCKTATASRRRG